MAEYADRIKPSDAAITTYLDDLLASKYQIPTFQRDVVWDGDQVKRLWDSVFRFYPIGSILVWRTDTKLQKHRQIGGFPIDARFDVSEQQYILDGQQRTTALLTALHGGKIQSHPDFDPTLYLDLSVSIDDDDDAFRRRFLFWSEIDDRQGELLANRGRAQRYAKGEIVKLIHTARRFAELDEKLQAGDHPAYNDPVRANLRHAQSVLANYRVPFIVLRGIQIAEVCQIFERINREGQPLDTFDIVVAKTYRPENTDRGVREFYLRELIDQFRDRVPPQAKYAEVDDHTLLQILATVISKDQPDSKISNITDRYLTDLRTEQIEKSWPKFIESTLKAFDFLDQILHLKGPNLVPFRYFYMTITAYFLKAQRPDYDFLRRYFWYVSFHTDDLLANTSHLQAHLTTLTSGRPEAIFIDFRLDKDALRRASYSTRGRLSRAILSLLSNRRPKDWLPPYRDVVSDTYYMLTDKPNLHHIFPVNFIAANPGKNQVGVNSLMNIAYITQLTNLRISDKNPVDYVADLDNGEFRTVLQRHLVPCEILNWAKEEELPVDAMDQFVDARVELLVEELASLLAGIPFKVFDSRSGA
jgi:hypothetical protein